MENFDTNHCETEDCSNPIRFFGTDHYVFGCSKCILNSHDRCPISYLISFDLLNEYSELFFDHLNTNFEQYEMMKDKLKSKVGAEVDVLLERCHKLKDNVDLVASGSDPQTSITIFYFDMIQLRKEIDEKIQVVQQEYQDRLNYDIISDSQKGLTGVKMPLDSTIEEYKLIKFLLVGNTKVGKTSLLEKYVENEFNESFLSTIGIDFKFTMLKMDKLIAKLQIFDTSGAEAFRSLLNMYYKYSQVFIVVYDITDKSSFDEVDHFIKNSIPFLYQPQIKILVGNKSDLSVNRAVTSEMALKGVEKYNFDYFTEISGKSGLNVDKLFEDSAKLWLSKIIDA